MKLRLNKRRKVRGFTLVEELIAMGLASIISFAALSSIGFTRAQRFRDREAGITADFMVHYLEHLKAMSFDDLQPGRPVNGLYDGKGGGALVTIPVSGTWVSLADNNYLTFHPELVWIANRQPQYRLTLTTTLNVSEPHTKHVKLEVRWIQPLSTREITNRVDLVRVRDL